MITTVLIDLDGTLSDSAPGILSALAAAFVDHSIPPLSDEAGRSLLGPPFYDSLPPIVGAERTLAVIDSYREHYATSKFDTRAYPGVPELLAALTGRGVRLAVATSKPEKQAIPIVEHLGLGQYFDTVAGDTMDGSRATKALVIAEALRRLGGGDPAEMLMLGDRSHDVHGAAAHGIACIGAGWGYGLPNELALAGAVASYDDAPALTADLDAVLRGVWADGAGGA